MNRKHYPFYDSEKNASVKELIERSAARYTDAVAIRFKKQKTAIQKTYTEVLNDTKAFAQHLLSLPKPVHHVAILGPSSYEWILTYFAAAFAGLVLIPVDRLLSAKDIRALLEKADVDCLVYDPASQKLADAILEDAQFLGISMEDMYTVPASDADFSFPAVQPDALFEIAFTSGTTGKSKGVMLTQGNIAANVSQGLGAVRVEHGKDVIMSVLPFNHAYEFTCTILGMFSVGVEICLCSGIRYVQKEMKEYAPTLMFIVPLLAEKLYAKIERNVKKQNKEKAFSYITRCNAFFYRHGLDISDLFLKEVKAAMGGRLKVLMCGGAPLSEELIQKFNGIGINLFQGYGLTECSPLLTVNFDYYHRPNSVGKVVEGCMVKSVDGELWAKGISVSKGYYHDEQATEDSFEDGWFKTGDLGYVDSDNFVFVTGRKKNLMLLPNGENVSAEELEQLVYEIPFVSEAMVYIDQMAITAELYIEPENGVVTEAEARAAIDEINRTIPRYKRIHKIKLRETPFQKTTSGKIKRIQTE